MYRILYLAPLLIWIFIPFNAHAYYAIGNSLPPSCAFYAETISTSLIIVGVGFVISMIHNLTGLLRRAWLLFTGAFILFFVLHLMTIIEMVSKIKFGPILCITEFVMLGLTLSSIVMVKKIFTQLTSKKSASKKQDSIDQLVSK